MTDHQLAFYLRELARALNEAPPDNLQQGHALTHTASICLQAADRLDQNYERRHSKDISNGC